MGRAPMLRLWTMKYMNVVLDKSYLRGAGRNKVCKLCELHNVLMPESLFFELLTTKEEKDRAICFGNLPDTNNPVVLVEGIGFMLRSEVKNKRPIKDVKEMFIKVPYIFNKRLKHLDFQFTDEEKQSIAEWQTDVASRVQDFKEKSSCVSGWFPKIKGYRPGSDPKHIDEAKSLLCNDKNVVREIYKAIYPALSR